MGLLGFGAVQGMMRSYKANREALKRKGTLKENTSKYRKYKRGEKLKSKSFSPEEFARFKASVELKRKQETRRKWILISLLSIIVFGCLYIFLFKA